MSIQLEMMIQKAVNSALGLQPEQAGEPAPPAAQTSTQFAIGDPVIVRSRDAGVVFGEYAGNEGNTVHVTNARQMWKWTAAKGGTLFDCGKFGVSGGKFSHVSDRVTVFSACAIINCTSDAADTIRGVDVDFS